MREWLVVRLVLALVANDLCVDADAQGGHHSAEDAEHEGQIAPDQIEGRLAVVVVEVEVRELVVGAEVEQGGEQGGVGLTRHREGWFAKRGGGHAGQREIRGGRNSPGLMVKKVSTAMHSQRMPPMEETSQLGWRSARLRVACAAVPYTMHCTPGGNKERNEECVLTRMHRIREEAETLTKVTQALEQVA